MPGSTADSDTSRSTTAANDIGVETTSVKDTTHDNAPPSTDATDAPHPRRFTFHIGLKASQHSEYNRAPTGEVTLFISSPIKGKVRVGAQLRPIPEGDSKNESPAERQLRIFAKRTLGTDTNCTFDHAYKILTRRFEKAILMRDREGEKEWTRLNLKEIVAEQR